MADIIKVKPKKNYEWNQDNKFIYLRIPMPSHTSLKKVDIFLSDLILRVTSLQKKSTHFLDLATQVDYKSSQNKFILTDGQIHATLKKQQVNVNWQRLLIEDISLADLKIRRRQSQARYEQNIKEIQQTKQKLKIDYDRKATQQLMRFQQQEREILQSKKKQQKQQAIREIFSNVNQSTGKIQSSFHHKNKENNKKQSNNAIEYEQKKWKQKEQLALKLIQDEEQKERNELKKQKKLQNEKKIVEQIQKSIGNTQVIQRASTAASKSIFTEQDVENFNQLRQDVGEVQYEQIPVRRANNVKVTFTERVFPHLAARDTHVKEPPMPKNKANKNNVNGQVQTKNPLWLKDKGDEFLRDKNYVSAIQAYTEAINIDAKMLSAYANRSLCHLKQFNFIGVISDCEQCLKLLKGQLSGSQQDNIKSMSFMIKIQTRKAIARAWKGQLKDAKNELTQILNNNESLNSQIREQINRALQLIQNREQSIGYKVKGDEQVKLGNFQKAVVHYDQSIGVDKNQYSISNKALCLNRIKQFNSSVDVINEGIQRIGFFNLDTKTTSKEYTAFPENKKPLTILLKLYYRKAKALEQLDKVKQAEEILHKGLAIDSTDKDFMGLLKQINMKKNKIIVKQQKQKAAVMIKQGKHDEALKIYQKCLKMIQSQDDIQEYLSILQNQCVCYLKLNDYDSIISTAIRILKIINNAQSKIVQFGGKKSTNISPEEMNKISVRTLMRRANAYLKKSQIYNAKADLQKALQINPHDEIVQKQLEKLRQEMNL